MSNTTAMTMRNSYIMCARSDDWGPWVWVLVRHARDQACVARKSWSNAWLWVVLDRLARAVRVSLTLSDEDERGVDVHQCARGNQESRCIHLVGG
jgi:hypothetical protein